MMNRTVEKITDLRHLLHAHAELSMKEEQTQAILKGFLREHTSARILDQDGWFACLFGEKEEGSPIAFRADMDGLPIDEGEDLPWHSVHAGVSHKCGHDGHMACLCGLAVELTARPVRRPVWLIFQPGEETGEGGKMCADFVRNQGIRQVYAFHNLPGYPEGAVLIRDGLTQPASEGLHLAFGGLCSHASSPESGRNPSGVIAETLLKAQEVSGHGAFQGMVLCTPVGMRAGNGDFGIAAGEGELSLTLRAEYEEEMRVLEERILAFAKARAAREGLTFSWERKEYFPQTRNTGPAAARVRAAAASLGRPAIEMKDLWRASEDFGYYTKVTDGAIFYIGAGEDTPALHTPAYDFNDHILGSALEMFCRLAKGV